MVTELEQALKAAKPSQDLASLIQVMGKETGKVMATWFSKAISAAWTIGFKQGWEAARNG